MPDYLLQSLLSSSFIDYNNPEHSDYDQPLDDIALSENAHQTASPSKDSVNKEDSKSKAELIDSLPVIYCNGETINADLSNNSATEYTFKNNNINSDTDNSVSAVLLDQAAKQKSIAHSINDERSADELVDNNGNKNTTALLINNDDRLATHLTDRVKKVIWRLVPENKQTKASLLEDNNTVNTINDDNAKPNNNEPNSTTINQQQSKPSQRNGNDTTDKVSLTASESVDTDSTPRKESLFKKHLKKSKIATRLPPKYVVLAVIDEGSGIPETKREEIFSPFVRLQQKKKGSGLGLSLVSQIVTAHQGRITTDTINGYTRFLLVLPVTHDPHYNYHEHNSHDLKS